MKIVFSTDANRGWVWSGDTGMEFVRRVEAGQSAREAIASATSVAAEALQLDDVGNLAPGLLADVVAIAGGAITTTSSLDVTLTGYMVATRDALDFWDVFGGLLKALVFGGLIALIACERGLATRGGAEGVGRSTTSFRPALRSTTLLEEPIP